MLDEYNTIIYGGSLHAVGIIGINFITRNFDKLKNKKLVVFATGASPSSEEVIKEIITNNIPEDQQKYIKFFYLGLLAQPEKPIKYSFLAIFML